MSRVDVAHMLCTTIGFPAPMVVLPTSIARVEFLGSKLPVVKDPPSGS
jgi:hypothetical protein